MGADASIFNGYANSIRSVDDYRMDRQKLEAAQQQREMNSLELAAKKQSSERENAFRDLSMRLPADPVERVKALRAANTPEAWNAASDLEKSQLDIGKTRAEIGKYSAETDSKTLESKIKKHDFSLQRLQAVNDPQSAQLWAASELKDGNVTPEQFLQGFAKIPSDPAGFQAWKQQAMQGGVSVLDSMKIAHDDMRNAATNATSRANNAASVGATVRGQNMTDARQRDAIGTAVSMPFEVTGPDGKPILVRQDKAGNIAPVTGYGAKPGKAPTEFQGKSAGFGARAEVADRIIGELESDGQYSRSGALAGGGSGLANTLLNPVLSKDTQRAVQAQRDFVNAVLRQESGAAISQGEFDNARRQYFPQPGDSKDVVTQKANNRKLAIQGFKNNAGTAAFSPSESSPDITASGATVSAW